MSAGTSMPSDLAFSSSSVESSFPMAGAVFLIVLMVVAVALIVIARRRRGALWRAPWKQLQDNETLARPPQHLSSLRLDATHRLHVIAWNNREFLVATGVSEAPVVIATAPSAFATAGQAGSEASKSTLAHG